QARRRLHQPRQPGRGGRAVTRRIDDEAVHRPLGPSRRPGRRSDRLGPAGGPARMSVETGLVGAGPAPPTRCVTWPGATLVSSAVTGSYSRRNGYVWLAEQGQSQIAN